MSPNFIHRILDSGRGSSLRARLIRGAMGVGGLKLTSLPISLAVSIILARELGPNGFGQYAFIMAILTILALPFEKGMRLLITRQVARYHHDQDWSLFRGLLRWAHYQVLLGSLTITIIIGLLSFTFTNWDLNNRWTLVLIALPILPCLGLNAIRNANLRGLGYIIYAQIPELLIRPGSQLLIAISLLIIGFLTPPTALLAQAIATLLAFLLGAYLLKRRNPAPIHTISPTYDRAMWSRAWLPFTLVMATSLLNNQIGILFLGWLGTDSQVGALRVADRAAQLVTLSLGTINMVIAPYITHAFKDHDKSRLQQLSKQSARAALIIALPIAIPLIFYGDLIINLIFGPEYVTLAAHPLAILATAQLLNVSFGSVGMLLSMSSFERDTLNGQIIALLINFIAALTLIPAHGAEGAAYAAAAGLITWNIILAYKVIQRLKIRPTVL